MKLMPANFWRIAPAVAIGAALLLLLAGLAIGVYSEQTFRERQTERNEAQARILAATVAAALTFDDRQAAAEYVSAVRGNPETLIAAVYDASGALFAAYARRGDAKVPPTVPRLSGPTFEAARLAVLVPVTQGAAALGEVYMLTDIEPFVLRLERYSAFGLLVVMAAMIVAVLGTAQRELANANASLAVVVEDLQTEMTRRAKAEEALRQSQKMEAIGQLTGGVAHDFNNLLQVIVGSLDAVERRLAKNAPPIEEVRRALQPAQRASDRAAVLTQRLLAFARRQPLAPRPVDVNRLVAAMTEMLHRTLGENIEIETVLAAGLWRVSVDFNQLESALLNLAVNARDAMPKGGKLTIETANAYLDEAYAAANQEVTPGQYVVISVADNGLGMTPEVLAKAFDPFFTTKEAGQGTGLGLSQVYGFVKQSGGHAKIYSELEAGTGVKLYLPRLARGDRKDEEPAAADFARGSSAEVILVVEDEVDVRSLTVEMVRELGYGVVAAETGAAALAILAETPSIRLLFTDVGLPGGMNGRQLADAARLRRPDLILLYTTGYARNAIVHHGVLDPGVEMIGKPFTYAALAAKLRALFDNPPPA